MRRSVPLALRRADGEADAAVVAQVWQRSAAWLASRGSDQWQYPVRMDNIWRAIQEGSCWLVEGDKRRVIATITLNNEAEPLYWRPSDNPDDALYFHRLVVDDEWRGQELGSALLDWAGRRAVEDGRTWLRLDAWRSNVDLHRYYLRRRFDLIRIVHDPADPTGSGACFQRPAAVQLGHGPRLTEPSPVR